MKRLLLSAAAALTLCGCEYPASSIQQGTEAGHLKFADAPIGASVVVDGQQRGVRSDAAHPVMLDVAPGKHVVEEVYGGRVLFHREYFVGAGTTLEIGIAQ
jgi:hypothetical protein